VRVAHKRLIHPREFRMASAEISLH
jgi:hypothetical protein